MTENVQALVERAKEIAAVPNETPLWCGAAQIAIYDLTAALEREKRNEWREGIVNVLDNEGNYLGCLGSETWEWTLAGGIADWRKQYEDLRELYEKRAAALERAERELGFARKAIRNCRKEHLAAEARAQKAEQQRDELRDWTHELLARAQKAEEELAIERGAAEIALPTIRAQLQKAEAALRRIASTRDTAAALRNIAHEALGDVALGAYDEPPTGEGGVT